jgi:pilus assembly protein CpaB
VRPALADVGRLAERWRGPADPGRVPLRRGRHRVRRWAGAGLAAAAVAGGLQALSPAPAAGVPALVLRRDLPAGAVLTAADVRAVDRPPGTVPRGAVAGPAAIGQVLAGGARAGEVLTDVRLVGPGLLAGQPAGVVAAGVRVADPGAASLAPPGAQVDVLVAVAGRPADVVARAATVLAAPPVPASSGDLLGGAPADGGTGAFLVLAVPAADAAALAAAAVRGPLSVTLLATAR